MDFILTHFGGAAVIIVFVIGFLGLSAFGRF